MNAAQEERYFHIADGAKDFFQWDLDRQMVVTDGNITELHFCNGTSDCSLVCQVVNGQAYVPNIILQTAGKVRVYGYAQDHTLVQKVYTILPRTRPADYVYTETEVKRYDALEKDIAELKEYLDNNHADKDEMVAAVIAALPVYGGETA